MSGQLRASESFFSYFRVEIVGPIFLSFLKKKKKKARFFDVVIDFNHIRTGNKRHVIFQQTISAHEAPQVTYFENSPEKHVYTYIFPEKYISMTPK